MEFEEKKLKIRRYIIIGIAIIGVLIFIISLIKIVNKDKVKSSNFVKQSASYTIPGTKISSYLPTVTIDGADTSSVNSEIKADYNEVVANGNSSFNYQYSINNNYFSLVTITLLVDEETNYTYPVFKTYNFSLSTNRLVDDSELLAAFNKNEDDVSATLESKLKEYYQGELDNYYLDKSECDYSCFLNRRKVDSYDDDNYLYVEDNTLKFFHGFMIFSNIGEEEFYKDENFLYTVE
ncbi:MAG: hypothetical protein PUF66_01705 [Clostridium sp.]|nr:hypothetical protein [Clostridium sp.]